MTPPTPRLMAAALQIARRGWFIFPLRARDKRPLRNFTRWEKRATRDPDQIYRWWSEAPYNIGVATGPSKLLVLDCDTTLGDTPPPQWAGARDGLTVLQLLAADAGGEVPPTLSVRTPSGGMHLYFRAPDVVVLGNSAGRLGWHIDTRGVGGYVVGPGSVCSGRHYEIRNECPVAQLPAWIIKALAPQPRQAQAGVTGRDVSRYVSAILQGEAERVRTAPPGSRNNALNIASYILGQLVGSGELAERDAWHLLQQAASTHVDTRGFTEQEMRCTINSGLSAGMRKPRKLSPADPSAGA